MHYLSDSQTFYFHVFLHLYIIYKLIELTDLLLHLYIQEQLK